MDEKQKERIGYLILRYGFACMGIGHSESDSPERIKLIAQADKRLDEIKKILGVEHLG